MAVRRRSPPREAAGQHFLRSRRLAADLVRGAEVSRGDLIVEIGGGTGILSGALARTGATLVVIERDRALGAQLCSRFDRQPDVVVIQDDIAGYSWPNEPFAVVANLPFVGSGAILARLLGDPTIPLRQADVIVQWEFAAKHAAVWPATFRSIHWRAWYEVSIVRRLSRTAFAPTPSVDAAVLQLRRRHRPRVAPERHEAYRAFLADAFDAREPIRRGVRRSLSPLQIKRLAPALGFSPEARAWDLDAEQWAQLFAFAHGRGRRLA
ncbi:MAG: rRNA adenine dimethyltransferase family protein [Gaiellaceae bacterium]